jgi:DNA-binding transcriptional LysR family regulator
LLKYSLRQLQYFAIAGETGSVTRASEILCVSQPTVSAAIVHLEAIFEVQLFVRHHAKGLSLTGSGRQILARVNTVLKQSEDLQNAVNDMAKTTRGTINVAWFVTLAPVMAPLLIREFQKDYEQVRVNCFEADHDAIFDGLHTAKFDMAITYRLAIPDTLAFEPLAHYAPYVIVHKNHSLAARKSVSLKMLEKEPLVLLDLPHSRQYFQSLFDDAKLSPNIQYHSSSPHLVRSMVANEFGYSVMNIPIGSDQSLDGKEFVKLELRDELTPIVLGILRTREYASTRVGKLFYEYCKERVGH